MPSSSKWLKAVSSTNLPRHDSRSIVCALHSPEHEPPIFPHLPQGCPCVGERRIIYCPHGQDLIVFVNLRNGHRKPCKSTLHISITRHTSHGTALELRHGVPASFPLHDPLPHTLRTLSLRFLRSWKSSYCTVCDLCCALTCWTCGYSGLMPLSLRRTSHGPYSPATVGLGRDERWRVTQPINEGRRFSCILSTEGKRVFHRLLPMPRTTVWHHHRTSRHNPKPQPSPHFVPDCTGRSGPTHGHPQISN